MRSGRVPSHHRIAHHIVMLHSCTIIASLHHGTTSCHTTSHIALLPVALLRCITSSHHAAPLHRRPSATLSSTCCVTCMAATITDLMCAPDHPGRFVSLHPITISTPPSFLLSPRLQIPLTMHQSLQATTLFSVRISIYLDFPYFSFLLQFDFNFSYKYSCKTTWKIQVDFPRLHSLSSPLCFTCIAPSRFALNHIALFPITSLQIVLLCFPSHRFVSLHFVLYCFASPLYCFVSFRFILFRFHLCPHCLTFGLRLLHI